MFSLLALVLLAPVAPLPQVACGAASAVFAYPGPLETPTALCTFPTAGEDEPVITTYPSGEVQRWNGERFETLRVPTPGYRFVRVQRELEAGLPVLYAVEHPNTPANTCNVWRFDGSAWSSLGSPAFLAHELRSIDLGSGPVLHSAGAVVVGAQFDGQVARFDGLNWIDVGPPFLQPIEALMAFDDGSGLRLFAAGGHPAGVGAILGTSTTATWDGISWSPAGTSNRLVHDLCVYDAGSGPALYSGAYTLTSSDSVLRRWNGSDWDTVLAIRGAAHDLEVADFGAGARLCIGAEEVIGTTPTAIVNLFDGTSLVYQTPPSAHGNALALAFGTHAAAPTLTAIGSFLRFGSLEAPRLARFDGAQWSAVGSGLTLGVRALAAHSEGASEVLVAVGALGSAGNGPLLNGAGRWNGTSWSALAPTRLYGTPDPSGGPVSEPWSVLSTDLGSGAQLFVGGHRLGGVGGPGLMELVGGTWHSLFVEGDVHALARWDAPGGTVLVVGGNFTELGGAPGNNVMYFGPTLFGALGSGTDGIVAALAAFDEGAGAALFAGGAFGTAGGVATGGLARWDGSTWSAVGTGISGGGVNALCSFDGQLYVGGTFTNAGGVPVSFLARWDGSAWSDVPGAGADGAVLSLHVHDDGRGPALYVGGGFSSIGGIAAMNLARFDGASWEQVEGGLDGAVLSLAELDDDGDGDRELFAGGLFLNSGTISSGHVARFEGCPHYASFCSSDGSFVDHTTPCPCANSGAPGHGCANSVDASGALLSASGNTNPDTLVLTGSGMPQTAFGIYLQHAAPGDQVFHDGVLCAGGNLIRLRGRTAVGGASSFPNSTDTVTVSQRGQVTPGSGVVRYYSLFYRNASTTFCPPATANVTNGVRVLW